MLMKVWRVKACSKTCGCQTPVRVPRAYVSALCCAVGDVLRDTEDVHVTLRMVGGAGRPTAALGHDPHVDVQTPAAAPDEAAAAQSSCGALIDSRSPGSPAAVSDSESARAVVTDVVPTQPMPSATSALERHAESLDSLQSSTDIGEGLLLLQQLKFSEAAEWFSRALAACPLSDPQRPQLLCHRAGAALGAQLCSISFIL